MKRFFGGLLLVTILSRPAIYGNIAPNEPALVLSATVFRDLAGHEIIKFHKNIMFYENAKTFIKRDEIEALDIDKLMEQIRENRRKISELLNDKDEIIFKIKNAMQHKAKAQIALTKPQILAYREFSAHLDEQSILLVNQMAALKKEMRAQPLQQEILKDDTDLGVLYDSLDFITDLQNQIINLLRALISKGTATLSCLVPTAA